MFQSISWSEFFTVACVLIACYYAVASVLLYGEEIKVFFNRGLQSAPGMGKADLGTGSDVRGNGVMGSTRPGTMRDGNGEQDTAGAMEELQFGPSRNSEAGDESFSTTASDTRLVGSVSDLAQEIKELSEKIPSLGKEAVIVHFKLLLKRYSNLASTTYRGTINLLIAETLKDRAPYVIGRQEIDSWWNAEIS